MRISVFNYVAAEEYAHVTKEGKKKEEKKKKTEVDVTFFC